MTLFIIAPIWYALRVELNPIAKSTATSSITLRVQSTDPAILTYSASDVGSIISSDSFFNSVINALSLQLTEQEYQTLFSSVSGNNSDKITQMKQLINLSVYGNVVYVNVLSSSEQLSEKVVLITTSIINSSIERLYNLVSLNFIEISTVDITPQIQLSSAVIVAVVGGLFGGIIGVLYIFMVGIVDRRVRSVFQLNIYDIPIYDLTDISFD